MIQPQQVQDGGVQIMHVDRVLDRIPTIFVGRSVRHPPFDATPCHPHRKTERMMVPAIGGPLAGGCPAKLATPDHQRLVQ